MTPLRPLGYPALMDDDVSLDELREAVEHLHGAKATYVETVDVDERFRGKPVWRGEVKVFAIAGHPSGATRAYAWSVRTEGVRRRFVAILGAGPVVDAVTAVRAFVMAEVRKGRN